MSDWHRLNDFLRFILDGGEYKQCAQTGKFTTNPCMKQKHNNKTQQLQANRAVRTTDTSKWTKKMVGSKSCWSHKSLSGAINSASEVRSTCQSTLCHDIISEGPTKHEFQHRWSPINKNFRYFILYSFTPGVFFFSYLWCSIFRDSRRSVKTQKYTDLLFTPVEDSAVLPELNVTLEY